MLLQRILCGVLCVGFTACLPASVQAQYQNQPSAPKRELTVEECLRAAALFKADENWDMMAKSLALALIKDPTNVNALSQAAWLGNKLGEHKKALLIAEKAIKLDNKATLAWAEFGFACYKLGEYKAATVAYTVVLAQDNGNKTALLNRAACWEALGEYENAQKDRQRARDFQTLKMIY